MKEALFVWIKNIAYYLILVTAMMHIIPNESYQKYIRLFTGMILILLLSTPILKLFGAYQESETLSYMKEYQEKLDQIQESTAYLKDIDPSVYIEAQAPKEQEIKIEKIELGE